MAVDATGTPSSNFGLPKYNTAADAPSGRGFNNFVDDLDTKLLSRFIQFSDAKVLNQMPYWDGSVWRPGPVVTTYVPVWSASGTAPALGNGTISGRYVQMGKLVWLHLHLAMGSTTTYGTGDWRFTIPVAGSTSFGMHGNAVFFDSSASFLYGGFVRWNATLMRCYTGAQPGVLVDVTNPFAWASGDFLTFDLIYEAA
jgi:hypothetical protein